MTAHILYIGGIEDGATLIELAQMHHYPDFVSDCSQRTRISVVVDDLRAVHDFVFEYQELFDNSYWRIVDLGADKPTVEQHRPQYAGVRADFVDVEWEFIVGHLSHPVLQHKLRRWADNPQRRFCIHIAFDEAEKNQNIARKLQRRLPPSVKFEIRENDPVAEAKRAAELTQLSKYLNYFYQVVYEQGHPPTELPEDAVDRAWDALDDETLKMSNLCNVRSIPIKMDILGHDRNDWNTYYALTADEIELLTAVEHNRWCVERLISGSRPCTDAECKEVEQDLRLRLSDPQYALENPVSLKKRYKTERNAHYDLCAFSELGLDETGLPVTRYDRNLTAAIPLIVKTYNDRHGNG